MREGQKHTEETKRKQRKSMKGKNKDKTYEEIYGIERAQEERRKRSVANKNKIKPEETKRKISVANKNKIKPEETKRKISESLKGKPSGRKDKTYEEIYGIEKAQEMRKKRIEYILQNGITSSYGTKGIFFSDKNQKDIRYDSLYELRAYQILEQLSKVKSYDRCRFSIDYTFKDNIHKYIPDIHVIYVDNRREIIEIKPEYLLEDEINIAKFSAARTHCNKNNLTYSVWTEKELTAII